MAEESTNESTAQHSLFPNSDRVYIIGSRPDLKVPMREIKLSPTTLPNGAGELHNEPVRVYDTAGAWGDESYHGDVTKGLPRMRDAWIRERDDVEEYQGREVKPQDDGYLSEAHKAGARIKDNSLRARESEYDGDLEGLEWEAAELLRDHGDCADIYALVRIPPPHPYHHPPPPHTLWIDLNVML